MLINCTVGTFEEEMIHLMVQTWLSLDSTNTDEESMELFRKARTRVVHNWLSTVLKGFAKKGMILQANIPLSQRMTEMDMNIPTHWLECLLEEADWKIVVDDAFSKLVEWLNEINTTVYLPWFDNRSRRTK